MAELADRKPERWDSRRRGRDDSSAAGTTGRKAGTSGVWSIVRALAVAVMLVSAVAAVNVFTELDDAHRRGQTLAAWIPAVLEGTSGLATLLAFPIVYMALRWAPPTRRPLVPTAAIHLGGSLIFSSVHVGLMELMRTASFAALHRPYPWWVGDWPYEYRKDAISYVVIAGAFWLLRAPGLRREPAAPTKDTLETFDIRDGAAVLRVAVTDIVAAQAAGNYVEFRLADGRRPLTRAPLRQVESALTPAGFVRTHRSWLVNRRRVRAIAPAGSGDFRVDLDGGVSAPLSRRFHEALATLREPG